MKALVVDHDRTSRAAVKRLLSHVNVEVVEAENGLVALSLLESVDPDFVVLEIGMPILNGPDCLAAIRQSPGHADIPVICITASGTRENVYKMVSLGVADFLLKPINPVEVLPRIKNLLVRVSQWRQRSSARAVNVLLMVDHDPQFLAFAKPLLESSFEVHEASTSTMAAMLYKDTHPKPTVVCLAAGLPLMNEDLLVDVIRNMAIETGSHPPQFFLLADAEDIAPQKAQRYGGVLRKSLAPQAFVDEFRRVVLREQSPGERLRHLVREELRGELVSTTQQTVGVMLGDGLTEQVEPQMAEAVDVGAEVVLADPAAGLALRARIVSRRGQVEAIGSAVAKRPVTYEDGASDVLGELANTLASRLRASLLSRGFDLQIAPPALVASPAEAALTGAEDLVAHFRCASGEEFSVALTVTVSEVTAPAPAAPGAAGPEAVPAGAAAADDVLF